MIGVYILECRNGRYYIGSTNNLERRIDEHMDGRVQATRYVRPVRLVFFKKLEYLDEARRVEYYLKREKSRVIIESIVKDGYIRNQGS